MDWIEKTLKQKQYEPVIMEQLQALRDAYGATPDQAIGLHKKCAQMISLYEEAEDPESEKEVIQNIYNRFRLHTILTIFDVRGEEFHW